MIELATLILVIVVLVKQNKDQSSEITCQSLQCNWITRRSTKAKIAGSNPVGGIGSDNGFISEIGTGCRELTHTLLH